ncbi:hypothetical protein AM571_PC00401 (plasmid) [Rhizobium etli 8C-3]|uniref:Uncharacterized protein n=1 Tax=Rhizobium etli 8C-3 TaxID=538025 RepID=A0A1L5PD71_RHIET|nr:hypothetical protein AM571_PC00401 [Rhizobium etli 8C-3]
MSFLIKPIGAGFHRLPVRGHDAEDWGYPASRSVAGGRPLEVPADRSFRTASRYDRDL